MDRLSSCCKFLKSTGSAEGSSVSAVEGETTESVCVSSVERRRAGASSEARAGVSVVVVCKRAGKFSLAF